jgi:Sulfotransferase domain
VTVRVAVWSGPRNISTALMRSWENRPDCAVWDEPFYAAYLHRTGLDHPARAEVIAAGEPDPDAVAAALLGPPPGGAAVFYSKQMSHHLPPGMDLGWTSALRNVLLIREPREVVASYLRSREACEPDDIGLLQQERLAAYWSGQGLDVPVVDSADFLADPEAHLRWLCDWLGIGFTPAMLRWPAGPRDSDGVWAPHWYGAVRASTGFEPPRPREVTLSGHDAEVAEACRPAYEALRERRLRL